VLADGAFQRFSLAYVARVLQRLKRDADGRRVPRIVFTKGGGPWLEAIGALGADVVGIDWTVGLGQARRRLGAGVAVQGNLDPNVLFAPPDAIRAEVAAALAAFHAEDSAGGASGHVFNLGHGISQHTPPDHVAVLVDAVHALSRQYHATARA
jgi:uroporphyrinogen decarboxylase